MERPRLSTFLRAFVTKGGKDFDFEELKVQRGNVFQERKNSGGKGVHVKEITWDDSFGRFVANADENERIRELYFSFVRRAKVYIGDAPEGELKFALYVIYYTMTREDKSDEEKQKFLNKYFSFCDDKKYQELRSIVLELFEWKKEKLVYFRHKEGNLDDTDCFNETEYGTRIKLNFESDGFSALDNAIGIRQSVEISNPNAEPDIFIDQEQPMSEFWLADRCAEFVTQVSDLPLNHEELQQHLNSLLISNSSNEDIMNELVMFLGPRSIYFSQVLGDNRYDYVYMKYQILVEKDRAFRESREQAQSASGFGGGSIIINVKSEKDSEKRRGKEIQKLRDLAEKIKHTKKEKRIISLDKRDLLKKWQERVEDGSKLDMSGLPQGQLRSQGIGWSSGPVLPEGAIKIDRKTYQEFLIPVKELPPVLDEELIPISEFDDFAQLAFKGYTSLNRIQSKVYNAAYKSNENLLICAPTGAGKTNIAMMTILHEIGQHIYYGVVRKEEFKIVYVAPMKALAAEMTASFSKRLAPLGLIVKELTGDMQLTKNEILETQVIVTTPEKWDVITRKTSDVGLTSLVRLLIIDEVHLLNDERGAVIETLVARTIRQVEQSQSMIRIVGLSATLPNYRDVSDFLHVDPDRGLFFFDASFRPVPLETSFIGVRGHDQMSVKRNMNDIAYSKAKKAILDGYQVMIFVHSRKDTVKTCEYLMRRAQEKDEQDIFTVSNSVRGSSDYKYSVQLAGKTRAKELEHLFQSGFGCHHAGLLRPDRTAMETIFMRGHINVLCCTATLAWGVNLPAHTVIIKGTDVYDSQKGKFTDLSALDVLQIFGRAGRPQFDTSGEAKLITSIDKLPHYLKLLTNQMPIESNLQKRLSDQLNSEIVLGTVNTIYDAVIWLSYTYLHVRMKKNPHVYGCTLHDLEIDPHLAGKKRDMLITAAKRLDSCKMIRYDERTGSLYSTDLGQTASYYYIMNDTIELFNEKLHQHMSDSNLLSLIASCNEFENLQPRDDELEELSAAEQNNCILDVKGGFASQEGKANILLQTYISKSKLKSFSLISDMNYVASNAPRIFRALLDIVTKNKWTALAAKVLSFCKMVELRMWITDHPLRQIPTLKSTIIYKLEERRVSLDRLYEEDNRSLVSLLNISPTAASAIKDAVREFPALDMDVNLQPITRTIIRVTLTISAPFKWNRRIHGTVLPWWIWVEDAQSETIHHSEYFLLHEKQNNESMKITFIIPILSSDSQFFIHAISDRWLHAESLTPINFSGITLPDKRPPHTKLLDLEPLPVAALDNLEFQKLYKFSHFNRVQTQVFWAMYHSDVNVLCGAPTGSGKTIVSELAILRLFRDTNSKVVYIGPLKALVKERIKDWKIRFEGIMGKKVLELTGDYTPDMKSLQQADIILTTPEKWDGISRNWKQRDYVKKVGLMIIDEIHLLGVDRGAILEVIVSRMRYISNQTDTPIRIVGLSTALANPEDLGDWLGIENVGLYNFHPNVRPVPLRIHIQGYAGKNYTPRMATMNKPCYEAIRTHSPKQPVLIFVSSRKQTRLTALDIISLAASDDNPRRFVWSSDDDDSFEYILDKVKDNNLKHTLSFGIGMHHAGLNRDDRTIVEDLFRNNIIQILISTSTLAWGVNLPAHLVIIKGAEYYDPKTKRYADFPVTDVMQMMGRAGRPQYDQEGVAVVMVEKSKKNFYKKFIFEPFPVESSLKDYITDHLNAEIAGGTITRKQDAVDYITWTYLFRRLEKNPLYYGLEGSTFEELNNFLSSLVDETLQDLEYAYCIEVDEDTGDIYPLTLGRIASYYYLHHLTVEKFQDSLQEDATIEDLLTVLAETTEYDEIPVRHNEENINADLSEELRWDVDMYSLDDPHTKANILFQAHFSKIGMVADYYGDLKNVLDQSVRIIQAMVDVCADSGWLFSTLNAVRLMQMITQGQWYDESTLSQLPYLTEKIIELMNKNGIIALPQVLMMSSQNLEKLVGSVLEGNKFENLKSIIEILPSIEMNCTLSEEIVAGQEAEVTISLQRISKFPKNGIYAARFPKRKDEIWWLVLGNPHTGELLALRKVTLSKRTTTSLIFDVPELSGDYNYSIYLMCDSYLGLDQQYDIKFNVEDGIDKESEDDNYNGVDEDFDWADEEYDELYDY